MSRYLEKITDVLLRKPIYESEQAMKDKSYPLVWTRCGEMYLNENNKTVYFCAFCFKETQKFANTFTTSFVQNFWQHVRLKHNIPPITCNTTSSNQKIEDIQEVLNTSIKSNNSTLPSPAKKQMSSGIRKTQYLPTAHTIKRGREKKPNEEFSTKPKVAKLSSNYNKFQTKNKYVYINPNAKEAVHSNNDSEEDNWPKTVANKAKPDKQSKSVSPKYNIPKIKRNFESTAQSAKQTVNDNETEDEEDWDKEMATKANAEKQKKITSPNYNNKFKIQHKYKLCTQTAEETAHDNDSEEEDWDKEYTAAVNAEKQSKIESPKLQMHKKCASAEKRKEDAVEKTPTQAKAVKLRDRSPSCHEKQQHKSKQDKWPIEKPKAHAFDKHDNMTDKASPARSKVTSADENNKKSPKSSKSEILHHTHNKHYKSHKINHSKHKSQNNSGKHEHKIHQASEENHEKQFKETLKDDVRAVQSENKSCEKSPLDDNVTQSCSASHSFENSLTNENAKKSEESSEIKAETKDGCYDEMNLISKYVNEATQATNLDEVIHISDSDEETDVIACFKYVEEDDNCDYPLYQDDTTEDEVSSSTDTRYPALKGVAAQQLERETILSAHLNSKSTPPKAMLSPTPANCASNTYFNDSSEEEETQSHQIPLRENSNQQAPFVEETIYACHVCAAAFKTARSRESHYNRKHRGTTTDAWAAVREEQQNKEVLNLLKRESIDKEAIDESELIFPQRSSSQQQQPPKPTAIIPAQLNIREPQQVPVYYANHEFYDTTARLKEMYNALLLEKLQPLTTQQNPAQSKKIIAAIHKEHRLIIKKKHAYEREQLKKQHEEQLAELKKRNATKPPPLMPQYPNQQIQFSSVQQQHPTINNMEQQFADLPTQPHSMPTQFAHQQVPLSSVQQQIYTPARHMETERGNLAAQPRPLPVQTQPIPGPPVYPSHQTQFSSMQQQQRHQVNTTHVTSYHMQQQSGNLAPHLANQSVQMPSPYPRPQQHVNINTTHVSSYQFEQQRANLYAPHMQHNVAPNEQLRIESNQYMNLPADFSTIRAPFNA